MLITVGNRFQEIVENTIGKGKLLNLKGYELVYIINTIEQNLRLEEKYDLEDEKNADMKELYEMNEECIIDTLLGAVND